MLALTGLLFLISIVVFVVGMIKPQKLNLTRVKAALVAFAIFVVSVITAPSKPSNSPAQKEVAIAATKTEEVKKSPSPSNDKDESGDIDYSWPVESYTSVYNLPDSANFHWKEYLYFANAKATDQIKFNMLAPKAADKAMHEANGDNFKEKAVFDTYWPPLKAVLDTYSKKKYLAIPFLTGADLSGNNNFKVSLSSMGYDFKRKGFEVDWFSSGHLHLNPFISKEKHFFQVEDETLAKKIEALRANDSLVIQGAVLFHLDGYEDDGVGDDRIHLKGTITHVIFLLKDKNAPAKAPELLEVHMILEKNGDVKVKFNE